MQDYIICSWDSRSYYSTMFLQRNIQKLIDKDTACDHILLSLLFPTSCWEVLWTLITSVVYKIVKPQTSINEMFNCKNIGVFAHRSQLLYLDHMAYQFLAYHPKKALFYKLKGTATLLNRLSKELLTYEYFMADWNRCYLAFLEHQWWPLEYPELQLEKSEAELNQEG